MKIPHALGALVAVFAALVLTVGTASADTITADPTPPVITTPTPGHHFHGGFRGGFHDGVGLGGFHDGLNGHLIDLDGVQPLDACQYGSYDVLVNRYGGYRDRLDHVFGGDPRGRFNQLRTQCVNPAPVVVADNGQCVTYRTDAIRYGDELNDSRRDFNGLALRLRGLHGGNDGLLSGVELGQLRRSRGLEQARLGDWNRSFGQLRTVCNEQAPPVTIVQEVQPPAPVVAPAPAVSPQDSTPAPAPLTSSGHYKYPAGAPDTGN